MEWSIHHIARLAGTTSRTLRYYGDVGLLEPSRTASNGYRFYDEEALTTLQRILLLRELGLGLAAIAEVLSGQRDDTQALTAHLEWLRQEKNRLDRQIAGVEHTIRALEGEESMMAATMFDGFDHTEYRHEVEQRWGAQAYAQGDAWWRSKSPAERKEWQGQQRGLAAAWAAAAARGICPGSDEAAALAQRQFDWLAAIPGAPGFGAGGPPKAYFTGLADTYVADERFTAGYGGTDGATFVRDAMVLWAEVHLA
jgi:DNA-binding transcriptional MerR regulator